MSYRSVRLAWALSAVILWSCSAVQLPLTLGTPVATPLITPTSIQLPTSVTLGEELFISADAPSGWAPNPNAARSRVVRLNLSLLVDEQGRARQLPPGTEIAINLFPDVVYVGVIDEIQKQGDGATWVGRLKDLDHSYMYLVYTAGAFIGHFASPAGVYEVSFLRGDLYQVVQIDQSGLEGGEEPID